MIHRHLPVHTNSSITCYRRCPREYLHRYIQLRRTRSKAHALRFGSLFHLGLNAWWITEGDPIDKLAAALGTMHASAAIQSIDPFDMVKADELMIGYTAKWGQLESKTVAVEKRFSFSSWTNEDNDYLMSGAIDGIIEWQGKTCIIEHKTSGQEISPGSPYWNNIVTLDPQPTTYLHAARVMGHDVQDCLWDVVRKVALVPQLATPVEDRKYTKSTKTEPSRLYKGQRTDNESVDEFRARVREEIGSNPDRYFVRQTIVRLEQDHEAHAKDTNQTALMIRTSSDRDAYPKHPNACERYGRLCDYHGVCSGNASIDNESMFRTAETPHEELA